MMVRSTDTTSTIQVTGLVARPHALDEAQLRDRAVARASGVVVVDVGGLLAEAGVGIDASHVSVVSDDGAYSASVPINAMSKGGRIHLGAAASLPRNDGGPFRLVVDGGETLCWNVKNVGELRCTAGAEPDNVAENPPH